MRGGSRIPHMTQPRVPQQRAVGPTWAAVLHPMVLLRLAATPPLHMSCTQCWWICSCCGADSHSFLGRTHWRVHICNAIGAWGPAGDGRRARVSNQLQRLYSHGSQGPSLNAYTQIVEHAVSCSAARILEASAITDGPR
jgi:hypothetical protein